MKMTHSFLALMLACALPCVSRAEDDDYIPHAEKQETLPFDSPYCDLNDNENIEADEMTDDNLCMVGDSNPVFSQKPIRSFGLQKGQLVITVDDGPNPLVTRPLLDLLDEYSIKATFFMVGTQVRQNQALVKEMLKRGHLLANHTFSHVVAKITPATIVDEIMGADREIRAASGVEQPRLLFRAPGLEWNDMKAVKANDSSARKYIGPIHANLGADAPAADWYCWSHNLSSQQCADNYFQQIVNGGRGVILSHDIFFKQGKGNTAEMYRILLRRLDKEAGGITNKNGGKGVWTFVNLDTNKTLDQFAEANGVGTIRGIASKKKAAKK